MKPYIPHVELADEDYGDQEIWDLVGLDPFINQLHNLLHVGTSWSVGTTECERIVNCIHALLDYVEVASYNRLARKHPKPSEQLKLEESHLAEMMADIRLQVDLEQIVVQFENVR